VELEVREAPLLGKISDKAMAKLQMASTEAATRPCGDGDVEAVLSLSQALSSCGLFTAEVHAETEKLLTMLARRLDGGGSGEAAYAGSGAQEEDLRLLDGKDPVILHADVDLVALWKPPNWTVSVSSEGTTFRAQAKGPQDAGLPLQDWVAKNLGCRHPVCADASKSYGLLHRLDRFTSGIVLCATTYRGHLLGQLRFATRQVKKVYLALCSGTVAPHPRTLEARLSGERAPDGSWRTWADANGRTAKTEILRVVHLSDGTMHFSLVEVQLHTGRQHQIRAHLAEEGHPLVGDVQYGGAAPKWCPRTFLHAARVGLHVGNGDFDVRCPLPADVSRALSKLERPGQ